LFASPKQASAMPARPTPNFFSAARRVTDWAIALVSSSNLFFIFFLSVLVLLFCQFVPPEEDGGDVVLIHLRAGGDKIAAGICQAKVSPIGPGSW